MPIKGFDSGSSGSINLGGDLIPGADNSYNIGTLDDVDPNTDGNQYRRWKNLYLTGDIGASTSKMGTLYATKLGDSTTPITDAYITKLTLGNSGLSSSGILSITNTTDGIKYNSAVTGDPVWVNGFDINNARTYSGDSDASISTSGGIYAAKNIYAARVFNAVFNDYAECRTTIDLTPGHVVID